MTIDSDKVASLAAARKAREAAARKAAIAGKPAVSESAIRLQVWILLAAVACAYLAYAFFSAGALS
jgi:hypothetical protein